MRCWGVLILVAFLARCGAPAPAPAADPAAASAYRRAVADALDTIGHGSQQVVRACNGSNGEACQAALDPAYREFLQQRGRVESLHPPVQCRPLDRIVAAYLEAEGRYYNAVQDGLASKPAREAFLTMTATPGEAAVAALERFKDEYDAGRCT